MIVVPRQSSQVLELSFNWEACALLKDASTHQRRTLTGNSGSSSKNDAVDARSPLLPAQLPCLPVGLSHLCHSLNQAFHHEKQLLGAPDVVIDYNQPPESFARLDSAVRQLMSHYMSSGGQDWQQYMAFNPHHYVRHLIDACDDYELMLVCWKPGQVSCVHNHAASHCWLSCLQGQVEERQYTPPPDGHLPDTPGVHHKPCPALKPSATCVLEQGSTGYINDHICLHSVGCSSTTAEPGAVTLHLYAPPIRRVQLYEPDEDRVTTRVPGFYSVRGNRAADTSNRTDGLVTSDPWGEILLFDGAGI